MKHFGSLCMFLILVHFSTQTPIFENCTKNFIKNYDMNDCPCCVVTCESDEAYYMLICAESRCASGEQIGYLDNDMTKEYPGCCGHPICKD